MKPPVFDPPPPTLVRTLIGSPCFIGTIAAAILVLFPSTLHRLHLHAQLPADAWGIIPESLYAVFVGFFLGYLMSRGLEWLRWKAIKLLLSYQGWSSQPKSLKTKTWAFLLKFLKGSGHYGTYAFQSVLPKLPLPNLEDTLKKWLRISECWLSADEFEVTKQAVEDFRHNEGPKLQEYLVKRHQEKVNWLHDYWLSAAYLSSRSPIAINSNYYCQTSVTKEKTTDQLARSANVIHYLCKMAQLLQEQRVPPTQFQDLLPICMNNFKFIYNSTRVPGEHIDALNLYSGEKHLVIIRKGHYFKLNMFPMRDGQPEILTLQEIYEKLEEIKELADKIPEKPLPVAALTTQRRDVWMRHRNQLKEQNQDTLHTVESALFIFVLEDFYPKDNAEGSHRTLCGNGYNTWFDKSFHITVYEDCHMGSNVEHTVLDGLVTCYIHEYCMLNETYENGKLPPSKIPLREYPKAERLEWDLSGMEDAIQNSYEEHMKVSSDVEVITLHSPFAKNDLKKLRIHPDGFVQMSMQLAYYRMHNKIVKTYQPGTTRLFVLGRTETINPVSKDSIAWVKSMDDPDVPNKTKIDLLKKSIRANNDAQTEAITGNGCDRHLFGLYCASRELGMDIPKIFMDKSFTLPYTVSTSHYPNRMKEWGVPLDWKRSGVGFAPAYKDGYGISYLRLGEDLINFHINSWKSSEETDGEKMGQTILQAMEDMKALFS